MITPRGRAGPLAPTTTAPETVYNLEVHGEHVYEVSAVGLLTHNGCSSPAPGNTRLWRAAEGDGLPVVKRFGDYNIHYNSTFKRFAFDEKSLDDFISANPNRTYTKLLIDVRDE